MEQTLAYHIQSIIDSSKLTDKEKLDTIESAIGSLINKIRKYNEFDYVKCHYKILDRPNEKGRFIVPKHPDIPEESWGKEVDNREICWYERKEDQFLYKIGAIR